ncbi:MAG: serine protein kinase PrkA [bacterium]|nr:serine protein kinase PrkA [bacterium]
MSSVADALSCLKQEMDKKEKRTILSFDNFLEIARTEPQRALRNIFQLFHDMVKNYVGTGKDEYPEDPESIGFIQYDCSKLLVEGADNPFFADRLFANRFIRQVENFKQSSQQNQIYIFEGPHGCGKSTFLNNLLKKFEEYSDTGEGQSFEIFWVIDENIFQPKNSDARANQYFQKVEVPCPSHDHPILLIPKNYRAEFLDQLLSQEMGEIKHKLSSEKEYEWIFSDEVCTICKSLFWALFDKLGSLDEVLKMVKVRSYKFDRRLGEGISIFNPGDKPMKEACLTDQQIQKKLDKIFGANLVKYVFSKHANTNNGIYVLMDIKSSNKERLLELHNVISEGVHKVNGVVEERINSLFLALMNPEDKENIKEEKAESFQERIHYSKIPYVMEVPTEVKIYRNIFGERIDFNFLPRVLENFARVIISSRMNLDCKPLQEWIKDFGKYKKYCDENGLLLRMEIYSGIIPSWLSEEDKKKFTAQIRRKLIAEAENEGEKGFSGRESIKLFGDFFSRYGLKPKLIHMANIVDFFKHKISRDSRNENIPKNFINSLSAWYDYAVLSEVKEALYFYNKDKISEDILNFLCAVNHEIGDKVRCKFTGKDIEVTVEFLKLIGSYMTGEQMDDKTTLAYAQEIQQRYVIVMAQELQGPGGKLITKTELYQELFNSYVGNLKEKTLQPFLKNENFRDAVKSFKTAEFHTFETRTKEHVDYMIGNLINKFGYIEQGAKEIFLHVVDNKLAEKFS